MSGKMKGRELVKRYELYAKIILVILYPLGWLYLGASLTVGVLSFHIAFVPLVFKYSKTFRRSLVFANFVQWPLWVDYDCPSSCGIDGARNLTLHYTSKVDKCDIDIGVWHILPKSVYERLKGKFEDGNDKESLHKLLDQELANSNKPIVMYCHGNSNNRATSHRILLYKFFQKMDFHTIAFDYRGYGDSTRVNPSEAGVVEDSLIVYDWLLKTCTRTDKQPSIYMWGHSLGTGISSSLLGNLEELSRSILDLKDPLPLPNGLILEAPFSNMADEVQKHPLTMLVRWLPYFERAFVAPFRACNEHRFTSDLHLRRAKSLPVLILHAKDDVVVPFLVGLKLYRSIQESRCSSDALVSMHAYEKELNLGHKYICLAEDLPQVVGNFVNQHSKR